MQLLDLPNELLLKIFKYGETDVLIGGPSQSCRRLREISDEPELWHSCLASQFNMQHLTPLQIQQIPDYREWCLKQRAATRKTIEGLDLLVSEMRESSPEDIEAYAWQVLKLRFGAIEGLEMVKEYPRSIAHYHWAHWLTEIIYRLEGVHMLLKLSTMDNWGNGDVERPIDQIIALYTLRNGRFPEELFNTVHFQKFELKSKATTQVTANSDNHSPEASKLNTCEVASELVQKVFEVFKHVSSRNDFLAVLGRGALFIELASQVADKVNWHCRLLKMALGSYVWIQPSEGEAFFVDFQREGKLRSLEEVRDRLHHTGGAGSLQCRISLYDTLATSYVWHTAPTPTRHCVLDLIEHAANDVKVTYLAHAPRLYANLVRRIINRNVSEIENAPLSRAVSSASLASMVGSTPGGWLRRGKVVRIMAGDQNRDLSSTDSTPAPEGAGNTGDEQSHLGVVLEINEGSVLVLKGSEQVRVIKQMLQPVSHVALTNVAGLQVPDIGADLCYLGQYFLNFNVRSERFE